MGFSRIKLKKAEDKMTSYSLSSLLGLDFISCFLYIKPWLNQFSRTMEAAKTKKAMAHEIRGLQNNTLRFGLQSVKSEIVGSHPLQSAYQSAKEVHEQMKSRVLADMYGSAFPLRMDLDVHMLSRFQRPPGPVPSSMLGLEALRGTLEDFGFEDCLNDPRESETVLPWTCIMEWKFDLDSPRDPLASVLSEALLSHACQRNLTSFTHKKEKIKLPVPLLFGIWLYGFLSSYICG